MRKLTLCLIAISVLLLPSLALAQQNPSAQLICPLAAGAAQASFTAATTRIVTAGAARTLTATINGASTNVGTSPSIHICGVELRIVQTTGAADYGLVTGTGTNCGTGQANLTPQWKGTASVTEIMDRNYAPEAVLTAPAGKDVCVKLSATPTGALVLIRYGYW
jgi:hypothetical protein